MNAKQAMVCTMHLLEHGELPRGCKLNEYCSCVLSALEEVDSIDELFRKVNTRTKQYYDDGDQVWTYVSVGKHCCCGSNCYHLEYDGENIYGVCNGCDDDLYIVKPEYMEEKLNQGVWK